MRQIARAIERGLLVIIVIDYGYTRNQQLAGRHRGTLMAYRHHSASPDPYQAPGEQDLTAHVNFTALAAACEQEGMQVRKAANAIAIPDGHWREKSVCRRLRRLPPSARTGKGSPPAQTSGNSRRHGRDVSSADCQPRNRSQENSRPERSELRKQFSVLSSRFSVARLWFP